MNFYDLADKSFETDFMFHPVLINIDLSSWSVQTFCGS